MNDNPRNASEQTFWDAAFIAILSAILPISRDSADVVVENASDLACKALAERRRNGIQ